MPTPERAESRMNSAPRQLQGFWLRNDWHN